jgi:hypothetical protein
MLGHRVHDIAGNSGIVHPEKASDELKVKKSASADFF